MHRDPGVEAGTHPAGVIRGCASRRRSVPSADRRLSARRSVCPPTQGTSQDSYLIFPKSGSPEVTCILLPRNSHIQVPPDPQPTMDTSFQPSAPLASQDFDAAGHEDLVDSLANPELQDVVPGSQGTLNEVFRGIGLSGTVPLDPDAFLADWTSPHGGGDDSSVPVQHTTVTHSVHPAASLLPSAPSASAPPPLATEAAAKATAKAAANAAAKATAKATTKAATKAAAKATRRAQHLRRASGASASPICLPKFATRSALPETSAPPRVPTKEEVLLQAVQRITQLESMVSALTAQVQQSWEQGPKKNASMLDQFAIYALSMNQRLQRLEVAQAKIIAAAASPPPTAVPAAAPTPPASATTPAVPPSSPIASRVGASPVPVSAPTITPVSETKTVHAQAGAPQSSSSSSRRQQQRVPPVRRTRPTVLPTAARVRQQQTPASESQRVQSLMSEEPQTRDERPEEEEEDNDDFVQDTQLPDATANPEDCLADEQMEAEWKLAMEAERGRNDLFEQSDEDDDRHPEDQEAQPRDDDSEDASMSEVSDTRPSRGVVRSHGNAHEHQRPKKRTKVGS